MNKLVKMSWVEKNRKINNRVGEGGDYLGLEGKSCKREFDLGFIS